MITRLMVANRAEIASRVFRTCRSLGIETVAVHSDADGGLGYVAEADLAVRLPGDAPADTYLRADLLLQAAYRTGADAVHPGYGFLSESADFARSVIDAGLTWIGPSPESIEVMGSKIEAKRLMREAGVPTLEAPERPTEADLPLLIKASAGGGGRGMRVVRELADLPGETAAAQAEAASAFGDGTVFVEPYVERGRHVEVQVVGSDDGVLVVGDRDCSIQRRHQKVVEEAPAPDLPDEVRTALHDAARAAAEAIDYRGAGTVEFLYDHTARRFYFLEMNTRLQVEHPVTEEVFGVDLVAMQIAVAEGSPVPADLPAPSGHAIEVRIYAEDAAADYQPQSGRLTRFEIPESEGIRVESGFTSGDAVSTHYDAMLAKVVARGPDRRTAARRLETALRRARIHGLVTNRELLVSVLRDEEFLAEHLSTAFLDEHRPTGARHLRVWSGFGATVLRARRLAERRAVQRGVPLAFRTVRSQPQLMEWADDPSDVRLGSALDVKWFATRDGAIAFPEADLEVLAVEPTADGGTVRMRWEDEVGSVRVTFSGLDDAVADVDSVRGHVRLELVPRFTDPAAQVASGSLLAPMPGTVVGVLVEPAQTVEAGAPIVVLEAMKMQHTVRAPDAGTVTSLDVRPGAQVAAGDVLAVVDTIGG